MFTGKCSRCEVLKADYEEAPVPYDLLLCKLCHRDVSRKAMTDDIIENLIVALDFARKYENLLNISFDFDSIIDDLFSIIKQPNY